MAVIFTESPLVIGGLGQEGDKRLPEQETLPQVSPLVPGRLVGAGPAGQAARRRDPLSSPSHAVSGRPVQALPRPTERPAPLAPPPPTKQPAGPAHQSWRSCMQVTSTSQLREEAEAAGTRSLSPCHTAPKLGGGGFLACLQGHHPRPASPQRPSAPRAQTQPLRPGERKVWGHRAPLPWPALPAPARGLGDPPSPATTQGAGLSRVPEGSPTQAGR